MIRHTRIGQGTAQVLECVLHDRTGTVQTLQALDLLDPPVVHVDAAPWVWDAIVSGARVRDRFEDAVVAAAVDGQVDGVAAYALYAGIAAWARAGGRQVRLLAGNIAPPRRRDLRRGAAILRREGLQAVTAQGVVDEVRSQVLPRVPALHAWYAERAGLVTRQLANVFAGGAEGVAVLTYPDGPAVADLATRQGRTGAVAPRAGPRRAPEPSGAFLNGPPRGPSWSPSPPSAPCAMPPRSTSGR